MPEADLIAALESLEGDVEDLIVSNTSLMASISALLASNDSLIASNSALSAALTYSANIEQNLKTCLCG